MASTKLNSQMDEQAAWCRQQNETAKVFRDRAPDI
jgi:hypothetical protein